MGNGGGRAGFSAGSGWAGWLGGPDGWCARALVAQGPITALILLQPACAHFTTRGPAEVEGQKISYPELACAMRANTAHVHNGLGRGRT